MSTSQSGTVVQTRALRGILLVLMAAVLFSFMDTIAKQLMTKFSVPLVMTVRYGLNLFLLVALLTPRHGRALWKTNRTALVVVRGASLGLASFFAGLALQRLPVGEAVAIFYLQTFGVLLASGYLLGERVGLVGWFAALIGFVGVLLIARPGGALEPLGVLFAVICAGVSVVYVFLSRSLAKTESTMAMLFYVAVAGSCMFGLLLSFNWQTYTFTWLDMALLFFMGAASLTAHFLFTAAYRYAPASILAPFSYFHIAFAVLLSWIVYNHIPDIWALTGIAMIAVAGAGIATYTHLTKRKEA
jgi:drug/metabolite transporter (DMT)-like permease